MRSLERRSRHPKPDSRRVLELLATATAERMVAGSKTIEIARLRITEAGRRALAGAGK